MDRPTHLVVGVAEDSSQLRQARILGELKNSRIVSKPEGIRLLPHPPLLWVSAQARRARIQADGEGWRVLTRWDSPYRKRRLAARWDHR